MVSYHKFLRPQLVQRYFNSQRKEMSCQLNRVFPLLTSEPGRSTGILKAISFCLSSAKIGAQLSFQTKFILTVSSHPD